MLLTAFEYPLKIYCANLAFILYHVQWDWSMRESEFLAEYVR